MRLTIGTQNEDLPGENQSPVLLKPNGLIRFGYMQWQTKSAQQGRRAMNSVRQETSNQLGMGLRQKRDSGGNAGQAKLAAHQVGAFQGLFGTNTHTPCADILGFTPQHFRTRPRPIGSGDLSYL